MMGNSLGSGRGSKQSTMPSYPIKPVDSLLLTSQCRHYQDRDEVPWDIQKYFAQRYSIFSRYDEGVYLTDDAWFGVTPEPVASQVAMDVAHADQKKTVLIDVFAGAGGNTIAFALSRRWQRVIAVERDASALACAQHNAELYGVDPGLITWVLGDSFEYLERLVQGSDELHPDLRVDISNAVLFASPPWGGPGYSSDEVFDLHTMQPYNLAKLHAAYCAMDHVLFLPRTSDIRQLARLAPRGGKIEVVQYCMQGASKGMVVYLPAGSADERSASTLDAPTASVGSPLATGQD
ncbi:hypothetical protein CDD83_8390 [Cordyceps sp. RAO-2017]|nr:hypothetical protein CDD83_8390 [Cordyceps sp. RAO-2017]